MKIQENLVWGKHNGELIGYVDLDLNFATLSKVTTVPSHVPVFLTRSIVNRFKFSLANFATDGISASQMFPLLWKAIYKCEKSSLKVIAVTCDGVSPNCKLFRMHWQLTQVMLLVAHGIYLVVPKTDFRTLFLMFHNCQKLHKTVYQILAVVNLHATCGMAVCFYYRTTLLTYFMKIKNVDLTYFQNCA